MIEKLGNNRTLYLMMLEITLLEKNFIIIKEMNFISYSIKFIKDENIDVRPLHKNYFL